MVMMIVAFRFWRRFQREKEVELDIEQISPADYTLWIKGLKKDYDIDDLKTFFENSGRRDGKIAQVVKINPCYDIGEFVEATRDLHKHK